MFPFHRQGSSQTNGEVVCHLPQNRGIHRDRKREQASARYVEYGLTDVGEEMVMAAWGE